MAELNDIVRERVSISTFEERVPGQDKIDLLFEAARWAPSSMNQQPWRYIYATRDDEQQFSKLFECLADGNKIWNKHVPVLILSIAEIFPDNAEKENYYAFHDTGLANQNLMLQAVSMGMFAHPMGGFSKRKAVETFQIPDNFAPAAMIAVGYKATHDNFPDEVLAKDRKERTRKPVKSIVSKVGFDF